MYKQDLAVNNLQWLIYHKTQPIKSYIFYIYINKQNLPLNNLQWLIWHETKPVSQLGYMVPISITFMPNVLLREFQNK